MPTKATASALTTAATGVVTLFSSAFGIWLAWRLDRRARSEEALRNAYADWCGAADRWLLRFNRVYKIALPQPPEGQDVFRLEAPLREGARNEVAAAEADMRQALSLIAFLERDDGRVGQVNRITTAFVEGAAGIEGACPECGATG